ncbi:MAG: glycoside hydrolase family 2 protein [Rikenellaceae bacterium]|jgi:beta-galactosidase|nr:glycoside hydrolase family 2 protein [Rikenellaceae bacterium]
MKHYLYILLAAVLLSGGVSAREVYNVGEGWTFFTGADHDNSQIVYLPHTWNSPATADATAVYRGVGNYTKDIHIPAEWRGKRVFLRVGGAATVTDVIINGRHAGDHAGGNSAFTIELTDRLTYGATNSFWLIVNNSPRLDVLPTAGEESVYGGVFRDVELIVTEPLAVSPVSFGGDGVWVLATNVSPDRAQGVVRLRLLELDTLPAGARASVRFTDADERVVAQNSVAITNLSTDSTLIELPFSIKKPHLWGGVSDPYLYNIEVMLTSGDNLTRDSLVVATGLRTFGVDGEHHFTLNGSPYPLRGVIVHRDRSVVGTAMLPFQIEEDVALICEMGANAVRVVGGQHSDYFYTLCDEAGLVVWNDAPFMGAANPTDRDFVDTERFRANGEEQLTEMIAQLYNHPCVAMWGLFAGVLTNGDDPVPFVKQLNDLAHRLDPTRLTVASSTQDGDINFVTDLILFSQSFGWQTGMPADIVVWMEQLRRSWPNLPAGLSYSAGGSIFHQSEQLGKPLAGSSHHPEGWQTWFHEEYVRDAVDAPQFWGVFVGNMFDSGASDHGLVTFDRKVRKDAFHLYKAYWAHSQPFVHITGKRLHYRSQRTQTIKIYSNQPEVELFVGGRSVGKRAGEQGIFTFEGVELRAGMNRLEARAGGASDRASIAINPSPFAAGSKPHVPTRTSQGR